MNKFKHINGKAEEILKLIIIFIPLLFVGEKTRVYYKFWGKETDHSCNKFNGLFFFIVRHNYLFIIHPTWIDKNPLYIRSVLYTEQLPKNNDVMYTSNSLLDYLLYVILSDLFDLLYSFFLG